MRMVENIHELLLSALEREAFAHAMYTLFAEAAHERGDERLAALFTGTARVELHEHLPRLAELAGFVGSDADNVALALRDESVAAEDVYPLYARAARAAGREDVAHLFEELAAEELAHARALEQELEAIEAPA